MKLELKIVSLPKPNFRAGLESHTDRGIIRPGRSNRMRIRMLVPIDDDDDDDDDGRVVEVGTSWWFRRGFVGCFGGEDYG